MQCVRIHTDGRMATVYLKRRDLLRLFALDPRDLRCIDPNLHYTRLSPSLYVRGNVILAQLAGVRLIITANTALLLDPHSSAARKLLGQLVPKLQVRVQFSSRTHTKHATIKMQSCCSEAALASHSTTKFAQQHHKIYTWLRTLGPSDSSQ